MLSNFSCSYWPFVCLSKPTFNSSCLPSPFPTHHLQNYFLMQCLPKMFPQFELATACALPNPLWLSYRAAAMPLLQKKVFKAERADFQAKGQRIGVLPFSSRPECCCHTREFSSMGPRARLGNLQQTLQQICLGTCWCYRNVLRLSQIFSFFVIITDNFIVLICANLNFPFLYSFYCLSLSVQASFFYFLLKIFFS